jgi:hypothetical protein
MWSKICTHISVPAVKSRIYVFEKNILQRYAVLRATAKDAKSLELCKSLVECANAELMQVILGHVEKSVHNKLKISATCLSHANSDIRMHASYHVRMQASLQPLFPNQVCVYAYMPIQQETPP